MNFLPKYNTITEKPIHFEECEFFIRDLTSLFIHQLFENCNAMLIDKEIIWNEYDNTRKFNTIISQNISKNYIKSNFIDFVNKFNNNVCIVYIDIYVNNMLYTVKVRHGKLYFIFYK